MIRSWDVQVTLLNGKSQVVQTAVTVGALHPGDACPKAYTLVRADLHGQELPKVTAVHFLVRVSKEKKAS